MNPLVVGCGEIGTAIAQCYARNNIQCVAHDPDQGATALVAEYSIVHVCVPAEAVPDAVKLCNTDAVVVVHSTTLPGTCDALRQTHRHLVHAPVEGRHPMISEYLTRWAMPVSGSPEGVYAAVAHLRRAGIPASIQPGSCKTTELAKHLSTLRLGWDVAFMRMAYRICEAEGVPFAQVYTEFTRAYNTVYAPEGKARPVLSADRGVSTSHCCGPNSGTLASWAQSKNYASLQYMCEHVYKEMQDAI